MRGRGIVGGDLGDALKGFKMDPMFQLKDIAEALSALSSGDIVHGISSRLGNLGMAGRIAAPIAAALLPIILGYAGKKIAETSLGKKVIETLDQLPSIEMLNNTLPDDLTKRIAKIYGAGIMQL